MLLLFLLGSYTPGLLALEREEELPIVVWVTKNVEISALMLWLSAGRVNCLGSTKAQ